MSMKNSSLRLPVGQDIFSKIIEQKLDLIDKTLFIKDIFDDMADVILITRPRRFGKTLNLTMLYQFLVAEAFFQKTAGLFAGLNITKVEDGKYMEHQGKYPAIFVTFKDVKDHRFEHAYACMQKLIQNVFSEHRYLLNSDKLEEEDKNLFKTFLRGEAKQSDIEDSFLFLSKHLYNYYGVKPWLLIDEYDTPLQAAYIHGYYEEMISSMRGLFGSALKTNPYLHKAVITGILRISKESLFSGLNNLEVYSVLQNEYSQYFGFTEKEMDYIIKKSGLEEKAADIQQWYNGYKFGETIVYNPWSIVNCVKKAGAISPYWVNTSGNDLIRNLLIKSKTEFKEQFEKLLQGIAIEKMIDEHVTFGDLNNNLGAAWSLLLAAGYLKASSSRIIDKKTVYALEIPNFEVEVLYCNMIEQWLAGTQDIMWFNQFLEYLLNGEIEKFTKYLKEVMLQIVSVHDVAKEPEAFYHGLMLGFVASLDKARYEIKSNKESGYGRYDIALIPKDITKKAIILELKSIEDVKDLASKAEEALAQINQKEYESEIKSRGIDNIVKIGIAYCGKELAVKHK